MRQEDFNPYKVGEFVKERRVLKGMTGAELAEKVNKSRQTIDNIEKGKHFPSIEVYNDIANALDVTIKIEYS